MGAAYLEKYALRVIENGYDICFIRPGEKRPFGKEWESKKHGPKAVAAAIEAGRGAYGVGVKCKFTPGVDIDCYDKDLVRHMVKFTEDICGPGLHRVGLAPKKLLVYRAEKPFVKTQSKTFIDDEGRAVKLEVLGDGQQFVAFHVHPDTEKPYRWGDETILDVEHDDLRVIDREDALEIVAEFERQARERGWKEKSTVKRLTDGHKNGREVHLDDVFASDKAKIDLTPDQLLKKLHTVPNAEDYDTWFHVGMARTSCSPRLAPGTG